MDVHIAFTWDGLSRPGLYLAHHHHHHHLHPMPHHHHHHHHHHDHPQYHHHHQPLLASPLNHHHHLMNGAPSSTMTARTDPNSAAPHREMASFPSSELSIPVSRVLTSPLIEGETQSNFKSHHFTQNVSNPEIMQDLDNTRQRNQVSRPPSLSLSISQSSRQRAVRYSMEIVLAPSLASGGKLPGLARLYMGIIFAFLGVTMAFQKSRAFTLINKVGKLCLQCKGYGVERCDLCRGRGQISWEGKLRRADPCPLCLGSCLKKCSHCGGIRVKKGAPPSFQPSPPKDFF